MRHTSRVTLSSLLGELSVRSPETRLALALALAAPTSALAATSSNVITLGPPPVLTVGLSGPLLAVASSGGAVAFSTKTPRICSVKNRMVTAIAAGTCQIQANQSGGHGWSSAPAVVESIAVGAAIPQAAVALTSSYYSIKAIPNLGGPSYAFGMNDEGYVTGASYLPDGTYRAFVTGPDATGIVDLGVPNSAAQGINSSLQLTGLIRFPDGSQSAFQTGPAATNLANLGSLLSSYGDHIGFLSAINNAGVAVGVVSNGDPAGYYQAVVSAASNPALNVILPGFYEQTWAIGVNNKGQIAFNGASGYVLGLNANRLEANGTVTTVPIPSGYNGGLAGINDSGEMIGELSLVGDTWALQGKWGFYTDSTGQLITTLGSLGGGFTGVQSVNNSGVISGSSQTFASATGHAFLTGPKGVGMYDLNNCVAAPSGELLVSAPIVNNSGQIIVTDINNNYYLLTPKGSKKCNP
jgi:hypothetical protein